jgi:predicted transcriptional regulator YdeE
MACVRLACRNEESRIQPSLKPVYGPSPRFERFDDALDFQTGDGGLEIWIPIKT